MTKLASLLAVASLGLSGLLAGCGGTTADDTADATLTVSNDSDYDITELYLTQSTSAGWGPDRLDGIPLEPDDQITLDLVCDTYDVKFVDETDVSCEVDDLDLCFTDSIWRITNSTCDFATARKLQQKLLTHLPRAKK